MHLYRKKNKPDPLNASENSLHISERISSFHFLSRLKRIFQIIIGTGIFAGYSPIAPGTAGSLVGIVLMAFVAYCLIGYFLILIFILLAGTWSAHALASQWGEDPPKIVIDEIAGMIITLGPFSKELYIYISGFILFRLFDIIKPFPCGKLEKIPGGLGIMLDDIAAALYACIFLYGIYIFIN